MPDHTLLLVDDSPLVARLLGGLLTTAGYTVAICHSGDEALAWLGEHTPDLVVTDILMPGMDGYELCRRIRAQPRLWELPVVALTSIADSGAAGRAGPAGFDDWVTKETPAEELLTRVRALAGHGRRAAGGGAPAERSEP